LQLFGNSVRGIRNFMKKYDSKVSGWDFNLGCPSKLSRKLGHGAALSDLKVIEDILGVMRDSTEKPVTIKIRKSDIAFDIVRIAEEVGVDAVCVHARTLNQGYSGEVDYDFALEVKRRAGVPVIFSGILDVDRIENILEDFDFVMIGRAAIGNPGVFGGKCVGFGEYLKLAKRYKLFFRQIKYQAMNFTKGLNEGKRLRMELIGAKSFEDLEGIMVNNKKSVACFGS